MITIYSKENCPNCQEAVNICSHKGWDYEVKKLGVDYEIQDLMEACPVPVKTVPQIFVDGEYYGGISNFKQKFVDIA